MASFDAGSVVGGYRLEVQLGSGGFGSVWRAQHVETGRTVALKVLQEAIAQSASGLLRHEIEVLAGAAAQHSEHLVRVLDGGVTPVPYIVMEYIDGADLRSQLARLDRLPVGEAVRIGQGVADALRAMHEMGVIHRDVKPANVMIDRRGVVKLTDFGIAKIVGYHDVTATGQNPLSAPYAAPEVWEQSPTPASDIYALGILLFECVVGKRPFEGSPAQLVNAHLNRAPDLSVLPPDATASLIEMISKSLSKDEAGRPLAPEALSLLDAAAQEYAEQVKEPDKHEPERFGAWIKSHRHESIPWAWHALHRESGENAVVEIRFAANLATLTAQLAASRRALNANPKFVPLGAERLLDVDRVLLRPDEAWTEEPPGPFYYLVARQEAPAEPGGEPVSPEMLETTAEALKDLIGMARAEGIDLSLTQDEVLLMPDGSVRVRHPGLPPPAVLPMEDAARTYIEGLPLTSETRELTDSAQTLDDVINVLRQYREEMQQQTPDDGVTLLADPARLTQPSTPPPVVPPLPPPSVIVPPRTADEAPPVQVVADRAGNAPAAPTLGGSEAVAPPEAGTGYDTLGGGPAGDGAAGAHESGVFTSTGTPVAAPAAFGAELRPVRTASGLRSALFQLVLTNHSDVDQTLSLNVEAEPGVKAGLPASVRLGPRVQRNVEIKVQAAQRRWFGGRRERSFTVLASGGGGQPPRRLDGRFSDGSMGPLPLGAGAGLLGIGGVALAVLLGGGDGEDPPSTPTATSRAEATETATATLTVGPSIPTGKIAFESNRDGNFDIFVMNPDGSGVTSLTNVPSTDYEPSWSPDGSRFVFASQVTPDSVFDLFIKNADGSGGDAVTSNMDAREPVWSPDGSQIAFYSSAEGNDDIYVVNPDGTNLVRLTSNPESDVRPSWSPDGSRILFASLRFGNWDIYVMNRDGSGLTRLTSDPAYDWSAVWSPDGTQLAFVSDRTGSFNLYRMNPDGSNVTALTNQANEVREPSWSPESTHIVFAVAEDDGNRDIFVIDVASRNTRNLTDSDDDDDGWPAWWGGTAGRQLPTLPATATPTATAMPDVTPTVPVGGTLFSDNFDDPTASGFTGFEAEFYRASFKDSEFAIEQFNTGTPFFAAALIPGVYSNLTMSAHVWVVDDPPDPVVGMACRLQDRDGYRFVVRPVTQLFAIEKVLNGQVELVYPHTESAAIYTDINYLQMSCIGNTISVWANGTFLASVTDDTFTEGNLFIATTSENGFIEARFDNLLVLQE